jgi:hypothetical protein
MRLAPATVRDYRELARREGGQIAMQRPLS